MYRLLLVGALLAIPGIASAADRPNFVFLFADDQRYDAMSCVQKEQGDKGRYPWMKTPNMDRIANEGVRFRAAFVVNSLCSPSRACFLTGQYSHVNGIYDNKTAFSAKTVTHASLLREAGYFTGYVGKWHMGNQTTRPGFDWFASFTGQSRYEDAPFIVNGEQKETKGWVDDRSGDFAIQFLEKERDPRKPFVLVVGFKSPHGPWSPPDRLKEKFANEKASTVPNLGIAPAFNPDQGKNLKRPTEEQVDVNLNYFRCIAGVDDNVGRILDTLDKLKLVENTVVVYSSDNGFYHGEHGLADKRSAYDESLRIPYLVRYPRSGVKGVVRDEMVLNIDLAPTFLDMAGVAIPKEMHGKSWKALLSAEKPKDASVFRSSFFYEYFRENGGMNTGRGLGGFNTPTMTGVRTTTHKLLKYADDDKWTELFDLTKDPFETKNLATDPAHADTLKKLEAEHARFIKELAYVVPSGVPKAAPATPAIKTGWVLDYDFAKDNGAKVVDATKQGANGTAKNAPLADGRDKAKARKFSGDGEIEVALTEGLRIVETPFTVEVILKAEGKEGVIVARGGATNGYALYLKEGVPTFAVNIANKSHTATAKDSIVAEWKTLTATLDEGGKMTLKVDGKVVAEAKAGRLLPRDPNDGLQIGADLASALNADAAKTKYSGLIERVRIHRGKIEP